ncbi:MAG: hypothetical protein WC005_07945 [Candidatus Nanopelagicales bacterium]
MGDCARLLCTGVTALALALVVAPAHAASGGPYDGRYEDRNAKVTMVCKGGATVVKKSPILFSVDKTVISAGKKQIGTVSTATGAGRITFVLSGISTTGPVRFTKGVGTGMAATGTLTGTNPPCTFAWKFAAKRLGLR